LGNPAANQGAAAAHRVVKIHEKNQTLLFSGVAGGYKMAHANHRRLSPTGFRNVAFVFKRPHSFEERAVLVSTVSKLIEIPL